MLARTLGAARLNPDTFEDVEHDSGATWQAVAVVILVSVAGGIGGILAGDTDVVKGVAFGIIRGVVTWAVWAGVAMLVGTTILKTASTHANWGQVARGTAFAQTPGLLSVLIFIPVAGPIISFVVFVWQLAAMIVSLRQTLDYESHWRAFFVVVISLIPVLIINGILIWALRIGDSNTVA